MNINARSIVNKSEELESVAAAYKPHIMIISETWLHHDIGDAEVTPPGYSIFRSDRDTRGGGVAILFKDSLQLSRLPNIEGIECVIAKVILKEVSFIVGAFYHPPNCDDMFVEKFDEFLCSYRSCNLLLAGDFNVPSVNWESDFPEALTTASEPFVDLVLLHDLKQLVKLPTRVQNGTESILDLFFVSNSLQRRKSNVQILDGISDHKIVSLTMQLNRGPKVEPVKRTFPVFSRASDVDILDAFESLFSSFVAQCQSDQYSVEHVWCLFKNLVHNCIHSFVPTRHKTLRNTNPWKNKEIVRLERKLKKARKKHKKLSTTASQAKICQLRTLLSNKIKKAKEFYQRVTLKNFMLSSPSKFWRHFSPKKESVANLQVNNVSIHDKTQIAEALNKYFCSVFTKDDSTTPSFVSFEDVLPIGDVCITEEGVLSLLLNLDVKKSQGADEIPNAFLVRYAEWSAKYLCLIFNKSLASGELPADWKCAKITPIPKGKENRSLITSYRPISLLSACVKALEHVIFKHISQFIDQNNIIDSRQHGFRRGLSTITQLLETIHDFGTILDKQGQVDVIFLDFEKAFDRVSHSKLLLKLKAILKNESLLAWIKSYLSFRRQTVTVDGVSSNTALVESGIPQGSILGPLFFLLFINDITCNIPVKIRLFADDCIIYHEIRNHSDQALLNEALGKIQNWSTTWQMILNLKKTVALTITRKKSPLPYTYCINNHVVSTVTTYKYLGVMITSDLKWNQHITYIQKKAMQKLGYLKRTLGKSTRDIKLLAFKTYVRPLLEYASVIWDPHTAANISKLEAVQRKAARFIFNSYNRYTSPTALLQAANLEDLSVRRYRERLKTFYLLYHQKFRMNTNAYIVPSIRRQTRSHHTKKVNDYACRTNLYQYSFFPRTTREWNLLPANVVQCENVLSFMRELKNPPECT